VRSYGWYVVVVSIFCWIIERILIVLSKSFLLRLAKVILVFLIIRLISWLSWYSRCFPWLVIVFAYQFFMRGWWSFCGDSRL
jgi:hypothetical protein